MATAQNRLVPTAVLVTACALAWLAAWSDHIALWLLSRDALPQFMSSLFWPGSAAKWILPLAGVAALVLLVWLAVRVARRWWITALIIIVGVIAIFEAPPARLGARELFDVMRPQLDEVATLPVVKTGEAQYNVDLPGHLSGVAVNGSISTDGAGAVFVPLWTGIPDDAGGYWYTPGESPAGRDMSGMVCEDPTQLDGDWWLCGVRLESDGTP